MPGQPLTPEQLQKRYTQGTQAQATGNRTYNGFAPSPQAGGGLNKLGYQKRDQQARSQQANKKSFLMKQLKSGGF
jgi:hypothetical protein